MFYSPNCPHCKNFEPEYAKITELVDDEITVANVNCIESVETCSLAGIESYPTTILFDGNQKISYEGPRSADKISQWITSYRQFQINSVDQSSVQILKKPYVLFRGNDEDKMKLFKAAVFSINHVSSYKTDAEDNVIVVVNKNGESLQYGGDMDIESLANWIADNTLPPIAPLSKREYVDRFLVHANAPTLLCVFSGNDRDDPVYSVLEKFCEANKGTLLCGEILETYDIYEGAHKYLRQKK